MQDNGWETGSIPASGRSPGEGHGDPLQHSCLENPRNRVTKSQTWLKRLSTHTCVCHFYLLKQKKPNLLEVLIWLTHEVYMDNRYILSQFDSMLFPHMLSIMVLSCQIFLQRLSYHSKLPSGHFYWVVCCHCDLITLSYVEHPEFLGPLIISIPGV